MIIEIGIHRAKARSGEQASEADIQLTRKHKEAVVILDLPVLDHLIVSSEGYYSFADEGLI